MTEAEIKRFCAADPEDNFGMPWIYDGWKYATDGRIAVRVPNTEVSVIAGWHQRSIARIFDGLSGAKMKPWPLDGTVRLERRCWRCGGEQYFGGDKCSACDGDGADVCPTCNMAHSCEQCDGSGKVNRKQCPTCVGQMPRTSFLCDIYRRVGEHKIAMRFDELIRVLPNIQYVEGILAKKPLLFRFDGGEGAVAGFLPDLQE